MELVNEKPRIGVEVTEDGALVANLRKQLQQANVELSQAREEIGTLREEKSDAYTQRNELAALVARMVVNQGGLAGVGQHEDKPGEAWEPDWRTLLLVDLPTGQVSYHLHDSERHLLEGLPQYQAAWDGHTTAQKRDRVRHAFVGGTAQVTTEARETRYVLTDGGIGNFAKRHGIDLVVVPPKDEPTEQLPSLGQVGFDAYGEHPGPHGAWKTFDGRLIPCYESLAAGKNDDGTPNMGGPLTLERWEVSAQAVVAEYEQRTGNKALADKLCALLSRHCGEAGASEGAVETLERLLTELSGLRAENTALKADLQLVDIVVGGAPDGDLPGRTEDGRKTLKEVRHLVRVALDRREQIARSRRDGEEFGFRQALEKAEAALKAERELQVSSPLTGVHGGAVLALDAVARRLECLKTPDQVEHLPTCLKGMMDPVACRPWGCTCKPSTGPAITHSGVGA